MKRRTCLKTMLAGAAVSVLTPDADAAHPMLLKDYTTLLFDAY